MNELFRLTRQHYEKNETEASLLSKVTKILESLSDGSVDTSQLAGLVTWASRKFLYPRESAARPSQSGVSRTTANSFAATMKFV